MAKYVIRDTTLTAIGDAIRGQTGKTDLLSPSEMVDDINTYLGDIKGLVGRTLTDIRHDGVECVAPYAFYNYTTLNSIELPNCTEIGASAFSGCTGLTSVSFPACASVAHSNAFANCKNIANVTLGYESFPSAAAFPLSVAKASIATMAFPNCTSIGNNTFAGYSKLTSVSAPACTSLGTNAFSGCTLLDTVYFPECTSASTNTFTNCKSITNATLGLTELTSTNNPFKPASATLTEIHFPKCTTIGSSVFVGDSTNAVANYPALTIADFPACTTIGQSAFYYCTSLTTINFPICEQVGYGAFGSCFLLSSVNLPACRSIGSLAFRICKNVSLVNLPVCSKIYGEAFRGCSSLTTVTLGYSDVCWISESYIFYSTPMCTPSLSGYPGSIYVPSSLVSAYKVADHWSYYADRITAIVE